MGPEYQTHPTHDQNRRVLEKRDRSNKSKSAMIKDYWHIDLKSSSRLGRILRSKQCPRVNERIASRAKPSWLGRLSSCHDKARPES